MKSFCPYVTFISLYPQPVEKMWKTSRRNLFQSNTFYVLLCPQKKIDLWQQLDNPEKRRPHAP